MCRVDLFSVAAELREGSRAHMEVPLLEPCPTLGRLRRLEKPTEIRIAVR